MISPVTEPTDFCAPMVIVPKPNSDEIRICSDYTHINRWVRRENYPLPDVDYLLAKIGKARVFSFLDLNSAYWQMELDESSKLLTTFITPFGRFCYNRLPFGLSSASERYQRAVNTILSGMKNVSCLQDDVFLFSENEAEHETLLHSVLSKLAAADP